MAAAIQELSRRFGAVGRLRPRCDDDGEDDGANHCRQWPHQKDGPHRPAAVGVEQPEVIRSEDVPKDGNRLAGNKTGDDGEEDFEEAGTYKVSVCDSLMQANDQPIA